MKGEERLPVIVFSSLSRLTLPWVPEVFLARFPVLVMSLL